MRLGERLGREFFQRPAEAVAPDLLGRVLVHSGLGGRVGVCFTEVEAYGGQASDPASHAHGGITARNQVMFGPAGHLYVYFVYGMHWCANVSCGPTGQGSAVLLRAGQVVTGLALARRRRPAARVDPDLARGPARLATALGIDGDFDGVDLCTRASTVGVWSGPGTDAGARVCGPRVGVSRATERPWRWWIAGDPTVTRWRPGRCSRETA